LTKNHKPQQNQELTEIAKTDLALSLAQNSELKQIIEVWPKISPEHKRLISDLAQSLASDI